MIGSNLGRYDSFLLCNALEKQGRFPRRIQSGSSIIQMAIPQLNIRFIDSFSFLPRALRFLPKDFNIPEEKSWFPHSFNTAANWTYVGVVPSKDHYDYARMPSTEMEEFDVFHASESNHWGADWCLQERLAYYCKVDCVVLRKCLLQVRNEYRAKTGGLDLFQFPTMASNCINALQHSYLEPNAVGLVPVGGYGGKGNSSRKAMEWLAYLEVTEKMKLQTLRSSSGEFVVHGRISVDGWHVGSQTAYNFHGTVPGA